MGNESEKIQLDQWLEERARHCEQKRQFKEAIFYWDLLLKRLTRSKSAADVEKLAAIHFSLGLAHRALQDPMKSMYHLKFSIRLNSSEPRYYEAFGKAFLSGGHWKVAKTQFEKAVNLDPKNITYWKQYAWVLWMMGKKDEARASAKKALGLNPNNKDLLWLLVRIYLDSEMPIHALSLLRQLKHRSEGSSRVAALIQKCNEGIEGSFEGRVLRTLRRGMRFDGMPFVLPDYRQAEDLWFSFCVSTEFQKMKCRTIGACAAALAWAVLSLENRARILFEDISGRFHTDATTVWPILKRLQEFLEEQAA